MSLPATKTNIEPHAKRWRALLAMAATVAGMSACGGDAAEGPPPPPPPPPAPAPAPAPQASDFYVVGASSSALGDDALQIFDPDTPTPVAMTIELGGYAAWFEGRSHAIDGAAGTATYLGSPMAYFVKQGQLYQIGLSKASAPALAQISSIASACSIVGSFDLDATGLDSWIGVEDAGADGSCAAPNADGRQYLVRTSTPSTTAPTPLGEGVRLTTDHASGADGSLRWMMAIATESASSKLVAFGPTLTRIDVVNGAGVAAAQNLVPTRPLDAGNHYRTDGVLRLLTGDAVSLSLSAPIHGFSAGTTANTGPALMDGTTLYFVDDTTLMSTVGTATPSLVATVGDGTGTATGIGMDQTTDRLLVTRFGSSGSSVTSSVLKASGAVTTLLTSTAPGDIKQLLSVSGSSAAYFTGTSGALGDVRRITTDGSGDALVVAGVANAGYLVDNVVRAAFGRQNLGVVASFYCLPLTGQTDCRGGALKQLDATTFATLDMGSFAPSSAPRWFAFGTAPIGGSASRLNVTGSNSTNSAQGYQRDVYAIRGGASGSLKRVTTLVP